MSESNAMPIPKRWSGVLTRYSLLSSDVAHIICSLIRELGRAEQRVQELEAALRSAISRIKGREWTADLDAVLSKGAHPKEEA